MADARRALPEPPPPTMREMMEQASRAVGRILRDDLRGITMVSVDDIAAMAITLIALGLVATPPGEDAPGDLIFNLRKEAADGQ